MLQKASITIGKWRRLQQIASPQGTFSVLAIDHRGPLRRNLERVSTGKVTDEILTALKQDLVGALAPACSAILLDPETGAGQCVTHGVLPGQTGLIVALDTGSTGDPCRRTTGLVKNWSVEKAVLMGASAVKLLIYYHPDAPDVAAKETLVSNIVSACVRNDIPFFLEPLSCSPAAAPGPLPPDQRREVVIETARRLVPLGVDILKAEFPVDATQQSDEKVWYAACQELTAVCPAPWVLLSAGVSFDTFLRQTRIACEAGASGVMVGRAVWSEAVTPDILARNYFLRGVGHERMCRLRTLCDALGRPFTTIYQPPELSYDWYAAYPSQKPTT